MQVRPRLKATRLSNQNALIILAVMMFIVILSIVLATVAFVQNDELLEDDDFLAMGSWAAIWTMIFTTISFLLNLDLEFFILAVVAEYLRSHIGEKRLGDWTIEFNNLFLIPDSLMTTLNKVVIYFFALRFYQIHMRKRMHILFPISRMYSTLFEERITQGGTLL